MRNPLMTSELAIIRQCFPDGGVRECRKHINRTDNAIRLIAWKYGIRRNPAKLLEIRRALTTAWNS